jgi:hypothetical protein
MGHPFFLPGEESQRKTLLFAQDDIALSTIAK